MEAWGHCPRHPPHFRSRAVIADQSVCDDAKPGRPHGPGRRLIEAWADVEIGGAGDRLGHTARTGPMSGVPMARLPSGAVRGHSPLL